MRSLDQAEARGLAYSKIDMPADKSR